MGVFSSVECCVTYCFSALFLNFSTLQHVVHDQPLFDSEATIQVLFSVDMLRDMAVSLLTSRKSGHHHLDYVGSPAHSLQMPAALKIP